MNCSESISPEKISARMEKARAQNPAVYLAAAAVICAPAPGESVGLAEGYSRGSMKRAVKLLRGLRKEAPQHAAYEDAITYIRAAWLHREAVTYPGQRGNGLAPDRLHGPDEQCDQVGRAK